MMITMTPAERLAQIVFRRGQGSGGAIGQAYLHETIPRRRARIGDTIDVNGRTMRVVALDGLRVAKVWLSKAPKSTTTEMR